jgi:predicted RNase H-like HicB family nuclease
MRQHYTVVYEWSGRNYGAYAPDVPGCVSTGKTLDEIRRNIVEALEFHFRSMARDCEAIPAPLTGVDQVERLDPTDRVEVVEVEIPDVVAAPAR